MAIREESALAPMGSDETAVDEESHAVHAVAAMELHKQDVEEQRDMIEELKAQRDAFIKEDGEEVLDGSVQLKRARQDAEDQLAFDFKEPEVGDRALVTNSRVRGSFEQLEPRKKSFVWGAAAFAVGMGAMCVNLFVRS
jgi:hypothetical protein